MPRPAAPLRQPSRLLGRQPGRQPGRLRGSRGGSGLRRWALIACFAVLLQGLVPGLALAMMAGRAADPLAGLPICHADGSTGPAAPGQDHALPHGCPLCQGAAIAGVALPPPAITVRPLLAAAPLPRATEAARPPPRAPPALRPPVRGPPFSLS